jgi:hypothetical protein
LIPDFLVALFVVCINAAPIADEVEMPVAEPSVEGFISIEFIPEYSEIENKVDGEEEDAEAAFFGMMSNPFMYSPMLTQMGINPMVLSSLMGAYGMDPMMMNPMMMGYGMDPMGGAYGMNPMGGAYGMNPMMMNPMMMDPMMMNPMMMDPMMMNPMMMNPMMMNPMMMNPMMNSPMMRGPGAYHHHEAEEEPVAKMPHFNQYKNEDYPIDYTLECSDHCACEQVCKFSL